MLVNLTPNIKEIKLYKELAEELNIPYTPQSNPKRIIETGIYLCAGFNFRFDEFLEFEGRRPTCEYMYDLFAPNHSKVQYGVADNIEQIKEYYEEEINDVRNSYVIVLVPVFQEKENKGKGGGWRWHKWGEYIGNLNPQCEYLDDEDFGEDFECVFCFHIYKVPKI